MPELPDLQAFSRNLTKLLKGKKVEAINVPSVTKLKVTEKELKLAIEGRKLNKIYRTGKELYFHFDNDNILALHLMLRGQLHYLKEKQALKYVIIEVVFDDRSHLAMTDFQGQATPTLNPGEHDGTDALSDKVDFEFLKDRFGKSKAAIKNLLLDQHIIRGIGNAYADEILWEAGISPFSVGNKIPDEKLGLLAKKIHSVLLDAEKSILKSNPEIISGEVREFLKIHNSKKTHSPTGAEIKIELKGGRKTYYTEEQALFK